MKASEEIVKGFPGPERNRAKTLRKAALQEGMRNGAAILEHYLTEDPSLNDSQLLHITKVWIKETKETGNE